MGSNNDPFNNYIFKNRAELFKCMPLADVVFQFTFIQKAIILCVQQNTR